jgi:hypothetical protein
MKKTICFWLALAALMVSTGIFAQGDPAQKKPGPAQKKTRSPERLAHDLAAAVAPMPPMSHIGPQPSVVNPKAYAHIIQVSPTGQYRTIAAALSSVKDAAASNRYAVLVAAGTYHETRVQMTSHVDLYGGFAAGDWKSRDVYQNATILDGQQKGPVVLGADNARLDGFVIRGGERDGHGAGILCDGVSPTIANNIIIGNHTLKPASLREGMKKQIGNEGAGIALLAGSRAYVANNLIAENSTDAGAGGGIIARGNVQAKIVRNVFCNNTTGSKDDRGTIPNFGSMSSPGAAIACKAESSPLISFNVIVLGSAFWGNDAGGIWVEGNSMPLISYNWIVGNTSYDDGGGIYVMGNSFYDEENKRHDFLPDGPVSIEDNMIAGNNSVYGGPGGVRVSRMGRVDLRRNRIVGNGKGGARGAEGGVLCVMENNIIADNGARKEAAKPAFRLAGEITARKFDARHYVTEISTSKDLGKQVLPGSVVRIGEQWSVVKSSSPSGLTIWGKVTDEARRVDVLDHYDAKK